MKKLNFLILIVFFNFVVKSQSWCPVGATWYSDFNVAFAAPGYIKYNYTGTTTINNKTCQIINTESKYYYATGILHNYSANMYTYFNNNVVYKYDSANNNFDTIYNFGASIGDKWTLTPKSFTNCAKSYVTVLDTGHKIIQSVNLRWLKISIKGYSPFFNPSPWIFSDTLFERIGTLYTSLFETFNLCPYYSDGYQAGPLRCYNDNQIINYKRTTGACDYYYIISGINELQKNNLELKIYPNPANDVLTIEYSVAEALEATSIQIINALGQVLQTTHLINQKTTINTKELPSGVYVITLQQAQGTNLQTASKRFIINR
jgi:hypothetical protein